MGTNMLSSVLSVATAALTGITAIDKLLNHCKDHIPQDVATDAEQLVLDCMDDTEESVLLVGVKSIVGQYYEIPDVY